MSEAPIRPPVVEFLREEFEDPQNRNRYSVGAAFLTTVLSTWSYADEQPLRWVIRRRSILGRALDDENRKEKTRIKKYEVRNSVLQVDATGYRISFTDDFHVLVFRGTEPTHWVDIWTDALVWMRDWNDATAPREGEEQQLLHEGFFLSFDVLWPQIAEDLAELEGTLLITGHSLGGAIALVAGRAIQDKRPSPWRPYEEVNLPGLDVCGVYTYGQPMVCNNAFAEASTFRLYRHVYEKDVVPRVPPCDLHSSAEPELSFVHFGELYTNEGKEQWIPKKPDVKDVATLRQFVRSFWTLVTARVPRFKDLHVLELVWYLLAHDEKAARQETLLERVRTCAGIPTAPNAENKGMMGEVLAWLGRAWNETRDGTLDVVLPPQIERLLRNPLAELYRAVHRLGSRKALTCELKYSFEDHIPSHYVEVSRNWWRRVDSTLDASDVEGASGSE